MSIREQMYKAQEHIQNKEYAEAREILISIDHPRAREWLAKLDAMAAPAQSGSQTKQRYIPEDWTPGRPPFNPLSIPAAIAFGVIFFRRSIGRSVGNMALNDDVSVIDLLPEITFLVIGVAFAFLLFTGIPLATNWRRLGRPRWSTYTLLVTIPALIAFPIVMLMQAYFVDRMNVTLTFVTMIGIALLTGIGIAYPVAMVMIQTSAYRKWDERDFRPMLYHQYPWDNALTGIFIFIALSILGIFIVYAELPPFKTYETNELTVGSPWHWQEVHCEAVAPLICIVEVAGRHSRQTHYVTFVKYPRGSWITPADVEESWRVSYLSRYPDSEIVEIQDFTLDGAPARYRDSIEPYHEGCIRRERRIYIVYGDTVYHVISYACEANWAVHEPQMMAIVNSLDLH